jgi:hypothetical protein
VSDTTDYAAIQSTPTSAGCYDCDEKWKGPESRVKAKAHVKVARHVVWIEGQPADTKEPSHAQSGYGDF